MRSHEACCFSMMITNVPDVAGRLVKACQRNHETRGRERKGHRHGTGCATHCQERLVPELHRHRPTRSAGADQPERACPHTLLARWPRIDDTGHVAGRLVKACQRNHETRGHEGKGHRHGTGCAKHCQERLVPKLHRHRPTRPARASVPRHSAREMASHRRDQSCGGAAREGVPEETRTSTEGNGTAMVRRSVLCHSCIVTGPRDQPERALLHDPLEMASHRRYRSCGGAAREGVPEESRDTRARRERAPPWYGVCEALSGAPSARAASSPAHEASRSARFSMILSRWPRIDDIGHVAGWLLKACRRNGNANRHEGKGHHHGKGRGHAFLERLVPKLHRHRPTRNLASTTWRGGS